MADIIATEKDAKDISGSNITITNNKMCTKTRASFIGCGITNESSYTGNLLVKLKDLYALATFSISIHLYGEYGKERTFLISKEDTVVSLSQLNGNSISPLTYYEYYDSDGYYVDSLLCSCVGEATPLFSNSGTIGISSLSGKIYNGVVPRDYSLEDLGANPDSKYIGIGDYFIVYAYIGDFGRYPGMILQSDINTGSGYLYKYPTLIENTGNVTKTNNELYIEQDDNWGLNFDNDIVAITTNTSPIKAGDSYEVTYNTTASQATHASHTSNLLVLQNVNPWSKSSANRTCDRMYFYPIHIHNNYDSGKRNQLGSNVKLQITLIVVEDLFSKKQFIYMHNNSSLNIGIIKQSTFPGMTFSNKSYYLGFTSEKIKILSIHIGIEGLGSALISGGKYWENNGSLNVIQYPLHFKIAYTTSASTPSSYTTLNDGGDVDCPILLASTSSAMCNTNLHILIY